MRAKNEGDSERVHCNRCRSVTIHRLIKRIVDEDSDTIDSGYEVWWETTFDMLQCRGCSEVVLRRSSFFSETMPDEDVRFFPPKASRHPPQWRYHLPNTMRSILEEVYSALDAGSLALPLMGARTLIDQLMAKTVGDIGGFEERLKELETQGFISTRNRHDLGVALDAGSAAAHRGFTPKVQDVQVVMDIVENLLQAVYVNPVGAERLKKATPPRPQREKARAKSSAPTHRVQ